MKCNNKREYRLIEPLMSQMITSGRGFCLVSRQVSSRISAPYLRFRRTMRRISGYEPLREGALRCVGRCPRCQRISAISFLASCTSSHVKDSKSFFLSISIALRSEEHTSELQSLAYLVCRLLL